MQRIIDTGEPPSNPSVHAACIIGKGVTISTAPAMFEVILVSLCRHVTSLSDLEAEKNPKVSLPPPVMEALASLVGSLTKACIATKNFDKVSSRKVARDVNEKLTMFVRDLFDFLTVSDVHKLVNVYFAEFEAAGRSEVRSCVSPTNSGVIFNAVNTSPCAIHFRSS